ncbi:hypothetical protein BpHYR1_008294 [Brachionus plicatilis]|uniref:Uncharacterized protein n=1 Tax=Brachionus plicatilis TaxID=10195 RepID=A0A3M7RYX3_BRAPC|nr:hypothetical protein BpHYR1_008294 [Brachionus plicatilis]
MKTSLENLVSVLFGDTQQINLLGNTRSLGTQQCVCSDRFDKMRHSKLNCGSGLINYLLDLEQKN